MNQPTLLLVDDDLEFLKSQSTALKDHFNIVSSDSVQSSLEILRNQPVDCALIDYYLNDGNGHDIAKWVAENRPECPVVLISAGVTTKMAIESFTHRIFGILEKPYSIEDAISKVVSAVQEFKQRRSDSKTALPQWEMDPHRRVFRYEKVSVPLTQTEVRIFEVLLKHSGKVVPREELVRELWGAMTVAENTLDTHLTNLRKKAPFLKSVLKGVRGVGYVLEL